MPTAAWEARRRALDDALARAEMVRQAAALVPARATATARASVRAKATETARQLEPRPPDTQDRASASRSLWAGAAVAFSFVLGLAVIKRPG